MAEVTTVNPARLDLETADDGVLALRVSGPLTNATVPVVWRGSEQALAGRAFAGVTVDAAAVEAIDGAGMAWLLRLRCQALAAGGRFELRGLAPEFARLLERFDPALYREVTPVVTPPEPLPTQVGRTTAGIWADFRTHIAFIGELSEALFQAALKPWTVRWSEVVLAAERTGADAVPIVALICGLVGLVLAFQSAMAMRPYGAEIYVANLVTIAMLRELGPLMTAVILSGRSGAAFAAEIGTMKVNDEVAALTTMGLNPVPFLAVPRVLGMTLTIPLLTVLANVMGVLGGAGVFLSLEYPLSAYFKQALGAAEVRHLVSGLVKKIGRAHV